MVSIFAAVLKFYDHITGTRIDSGPASAVYVAVCGALPPLWRERSCICVTFPLPGVKLEVPILSGILMETPMTEERKHAITFRRDTPLRAEDDRDHGFRQAEFREAVFRG